MRLILATVCLTGTVAVAGCSAFYDHVHDPGLVVPTADVLKSLRCELSTYFEANYQRSLQHDASIDVIGLPEANRRFGYLDIDRWQYAAIEINFTDTITAGVGLGSDLIYRFGPSNGYSRDYNVSPLLSVSGSYVKNELFAIPQYASLGPVFSFIRDDTEKLYYDESRAAPDRNYFCFKSLGPLKTSRSERLDDLQRLVLDGLPDRDNFERVWVDGTRTLAAWLQASSQELSDLQRTTVATSENLIPAQVWYSFALETKASASGKFTYISHVLSPLVPSLNGGADNANKFTIYLNAAKAKAAAAAKVGQASITEAQTKLVPQTAGVKSEVVVVPKTK